jgi:hypothetical protein
MAFIFELWSDVSTNAFNFFCSCKSAWSIVVPAASGSGSASPAISLLADPPIDAGSVRIMDEQVIAGFFVMAFCDTDIKQEAASIVCSSSSIRSSCPFSVPVRSVLSNQPSNHKSLEFLMKNRNAMTGAHCTGGRLCMLAGSLKYFGSRESRFFVSSNAHSSGSNSPAAYGGFCFSSK